MYGNAFILPLLGGSGGGGSNAGSGGGGGGGAILIAASQSIQLNGSISADGGTFNFNGSASGGGSGGAVRLVATSLGGTGSAGSISTNGGRTVSIGTYAGNGRVRLDIYANNFGGTISGSLSQGFQPIIIPAAGQGVQLSIASVAGAAVPANPGGVIVNPDVIISAQQANPIPVVVNCSNIPLNTEITVKVHPANGRT